MPRDLDRRQLRVAGLAYLMGLHEAEHIAEP